MQGANIFIDYYKYKEYIKFVGLEINWKCQPRNNIPEVVKHYCIFSILDDRKLKDHLIIDLEKYYENNNKNIFL